MDDARRYVNSLNQMELFSRAKICNDTDSSDQSYNGSTIINYDSRGVPDLKIMIVNCF